MFKSGQNYWTMTPNYIASDWAINYVVSTSSSLSYYHIDYNYGVRPVITLKPDIEYKSGNGSVSTPYVINTDDVD